MDTIKSKKTIPSIHVAGILTGFSIALPAYITSTFLIQFVPADMVGLLYAVASALAIIFFALTPKILRAIGNFRFTLIIITLALFSVLGLAFVKNTALVVILFIVYFLYTAIMYLCLDIFLEHHSEDKITGGIRGAYLALSNGAWIISQIVVGYVLTNSDYWKIFVLSAVFIIISGALIINKFKTFVDRPYEKINYRRAWLDIFSNKNILGILSASFLLQLFFSWMIIYTPIYLHETIGFEWSQIGWIFSVMLLPFIITEYPLGKLADNKLGEKEMLIGGFFVMAITAGFMSFITTPNLGLWMAILFMSRVGASTVEAMTETYFFKKVTDHNTGYISIFRTTKPWAYIVGPASATLFLSFYDIKFLFLALGAIMILGVFSALAIKDTR